MIVKLGQNPGFEDYVRRNKIVKAAMMREDFLVETSIGFLAGKKGDFIVELGKGVRFPCGAKSFYNACAPRDIE